MLRAAARHPDHDARVAVPAADVADAREVLRTVDDGDRRRDPRRRRHEARRAPGAVARAARRHCAAASRSGSALSATQRPLEEIARFLGGDRDGRRSSTPARRKELDLEIVVPVEDMASVCRDAPSARPSGAATRRPARASGRPSTRGCCGWSRAHATTLVFVNYRRLAERLALRLNELAGARSSPAPTTARWRARRARDRGGAEAGRAARAWWPRSSLELGIDMGAVDLVVQIESPGSVARGLQRIGRAGHQVGAPSARGRIFPKYRGDLLECAVVARRMRDGGDRGDARPRATPLDVLAQQIVARVRDRRRGTVDDLLRARAPRVPATRELAARRSSTACSTCCRAGTRRTSSPSCGRGSSGTAIAGSIARPANGAAARRRDERRHDPRPRPLRRVPASTAAAAVGELDEEMVYEAARRRGVRARRVGVAHRARSPATACSSRPRPASPGRCRSGRARRPGRPLELGARDRRVRARDSAR